MYLTARSMADDTDTRSYLFKVNIRLKITRSENTKICNDNVTKSCRPLRHFCNVFGQFSQTLRPGWPVSSFRPQKVTFLVTVYLVILWPNLQQNRRSLRQNHCSSVTHFGAAVVSERAEKLRGITFFLYFNVNSSKYTLLT